MSAGYVPNRLKEEANLSEKEDKYTDLVEDVQAAYIRVGGCFLRRSDMENISLAQFLDTAVKNGIEVNIK